MASMGHVLDFLASGSNRALPGKLLLVGGDAYLERQLKLKLRSLELALYERSLPKTGADVDLVDLSRGGNLFSSSALLWLRDVSAPSAWSARSKKNFEDLVDAADGNSFHLWVSVDEVPKKGIFSEWPSINISLEAHDRLRLFDELARRVELKVTAEQRKMMENFVGGGDELFQFVELWSLGGRVALEEQLWRYLDSPSIKNPAFSWVDAVLEGQSTAALKYFKLLQEQDAESFQLTALLGKSLRIAVSLIEGVPVPGAPPFLKDKISRQLNKIDKPKGRAHRMLASLSEIDRRAKLGADLTLHLERLSSGPL